MLTSQVTAHGLAGNLHFSGGGADRLALAVPCPDIVVTFEPLLLFGSFGLGTRRQGGWWCHGSRRSEGGRLLLPRLVARSGQRLRGCGRPQRLLDVVVTPLEEPFDGFTQI